MRFASPYLLLLLVLPLGVLYHYFHTRKRRRAAITFSDISFIKKLPQARSLKYRHLLIIIRVTLLMVLVIALARPQAGRKESEIITKGVDILLCLDISSSMKAEDFKPRNRLYAAKKVVHDFVTDRKNDRLGLVVFAGESFTQCPLTLDYGVLLEFLNHVEMGMVEDGTAIGMAIATCVNRLRDSDAKSKVVVLLTDGENNAGAVDPVTAARAAAAMGVKIYTVGAGKKGGAPIPVEHPLFGKTYARNSDGSLYLTKIDEKMLQEIATISGGRYYRATNTDKLEQIYEEIGKLEQTKIKTREYMNYDERFWGFVLIALLLLVIEIVLANTKFRKIP